MKTTLKSPHGLYTFHRFSSTENWRKWTKDGIVAEDAPIIMGESPWNNWDDLLKEKTSEHPRKTTPSMEKALLARPLILKKYKEASQEDLQPANIQSKERPWQRACLDAISKNRWHIVEFKAGEFAYQKATEVGRVPSFYYAEAQHILSITGLQYINFHFHTGEEETQPLNLPVRRNNKYIEALIEKEKEFVQALQNKKLNPSRQTLKTVLAAITHTGPKVDYQTYQIIIPKFADKTGKLTPEGELLLQEK
jgi:putative phage-type endonuclease